MHPVASGLRTTGRLAAVELVLVGGGYMLGQAVGLCIVTGARIVDRARARRAPREPERRYPVGGPTSRARQRGDRP